MCCIVLLFTAVTALAGRVFGVLRRESRAYARLCVLKLLTDIFLKVTNRLAKVCLQIVYTVLYLKST